MSVQGCLEYCMERRTGAPKPQKQSLKIDIDHRLEMLRLKRELENDDFTLQGVNLTEMGKSSTERSENAKKSKNVNFGQRITGWDK